MVYERAGIVRKNWDKVIDFNSTIMWNCIRVNVAAKSRLYAVLDPQ